MIHTVRVLLTPAWDGESVSSLGVRIDTDIPAVKDAPLFRIHRQSIDKPFLALEEPFALTDGAGTLGGGWKEESKPPYLDRVFTPYRDGGTGFSLAYRVKPVPAGGNPVLDLGAEPGGMTGSGMTFLPEFLSDDPADFTVRWDLSALPEDASAAWTFGEHRRGGGKTLTESFYACGLLDGVRAGNFRYFWLRNDALLDTAVTAAKLFRMEADFFSDGGEPYAIFARRVPFPVKPGGTALERSYLYLYNSPEQLDSSLLFLFAHEMVHNWITLPDEPYGTTTWYVEGMAEFYSTVLPWRAGLVSADALCRELNSRAKDYWENPAIRTPNLVLGENFLADLEMTKVPYGRGFFYLTSADAAIRRATDSERSLDDVMRALKDLSPETDGNEAWIAEYGKYVGTDTARREYERLRDGGIMTPQTDCFPGISVRKKEGRVRGTEEPCELWEFTAL